MVFERLVEPQTSLQFFGSTSESFKVFGLTLEIFGRIRINLRKTSEDFGSKLNTSKNFESTSKIFDVFGSR